MTAKAVVETVGAVLNDSPKTLTTDREIYRLRIRGLGCHRGRTTMARMAITSWTRHPAVCIRSGCVHPILVDYFFSSD
jgi:hypothetical protein